MLDTGEFDRWFKSGKLTLESARHDLGGGFYNWACFKAQQSAELAVKAYFYGIGQPKTGHTVSYLLSLLNVPQDLVDKAKYLDKLYIPTRYPDAWQSETPQYYYTKGEAEEAIKYAEEIINYIEGLWRTLLQREKERGGK
ncbi:HEPN domain-containing protein [Stygiolobus caldivivus]|uniref:DNA-binding protein n=1 Tax=Stygiolobus caldivivus TaxID=2824673 RepID=A0A8D5U6M0_9CREN|nr:HEPN domain-containing protein [Stygiolobus caldivivus]BCU69953.1 DNA-binding protein [Stygiolobus caldivivus]